MAEHTGTKGKLVGEEEGQAMGFRVLPDEGKGQWVEVSVRNQGTFLGERSTNLMTYRTTMKPDGSLHGEGQGMAYLADGSTTGWVGTGTGTQKQPGGPQVWRATVHLRNPTGKYTGLADRPIIVEYEVDQTWKSRARFFDSK
jgi:hypothetical protein